MHRPPYVPPRAGAFLTLVLIIAIFSANTVPQAQALTYAAPPQPFSNTSAPPQLNPAALLGGDPADQAQASPFLMDAGASLQPNPQQPGALSDALAISRIQSTYAAAPSLPATVVITFTVMNQLPFLDAAQPPEQHLEGGAASITDTMAAVSAYDPADDSNTIHNALLSASLVAPTRYLSSSSTPDHDASTYLWALGDIAPQETVTRTVTLQLPARSRDVVELDTGATVYGTQGVRLVTAHAAPAMLGPDTIAGAPVGDWLRSTPDANTADLYMLNQAANLGQDPLRMFAYVRALGYEAYTGSLRGTRGTLWSQAGNALDKSSLLIAMLRASGVPARYRHGALSQARAQLLLSSMFPQPTQLVGHVPPGAPTSDPLHDPQLLREAQEHWWVEAYLPSQGWTDLDPSFSGAQPGERFVEDARIAADGTDRIVEVPGRERHTVTMRVKIEKHDPFPSSDTLAESYPLSATFNAVELAGNPVTLGHLVSTEDSSDNAMCTCGLFRLIQHTYTPYFSFDSRTIQGAPFQDWLSNFPFGTSLVTGEWLVFDVRDRDGRTTSYVREIKDRLGFQVRQSGGDIALPAFTNETPALLNAFDQVVAYISTGANPQQGLSQTLQAFRQTSADVAHEAARTDPSADRGIMNLSMAGNAQMLTAIAQFYAINSDFSSALIARSSLVKTYRASPAIVLSAGDVTLDQNGAPTNLVTTLDLLKNDRRVQPYPRQAEEARLIAHSLQGITDTFLESIIYEQLGITPQTSVKNILMTAVEQQIKTCLVHPQKLDALADMHLSAEATARMTAAVSERGQTILAPCEMVDLPTGPTIAWLEIDPQSGQTIGVQENGLHSAYVDYRMLLRQTLKYGSSAAILSGFFLPFWFYLAGGLSSYANVIFNGIDLVCTFTTCPLWLIKLNWMAHLVTWAQDPTTLEYFTALKEFDLIAFELDPEGSPTRYTSGFGIGFALGMTLVLGVMAGLDPPLPQQYIDAGALTPPQAQARAAAVLTAQRTTAAADATANLTTSHASLADLKRSVWRSRTAAHFTLAEATLSQATLTASDGAALGAGLVHVAPASSAAALTAAPGVEIDVSNGGALSMYAAASSGMAMSGAGEEWTARLTSTQPYTLTLHDAVVTLNNTDTYTGSFTLAAASLTTITGAGDSALPNFADPVAFEAQQTQLMLGPASGSLSIGDQTIDPSNGLAIADYTGAIKVSEASATTDRIELSGAARFFTLHTAPATSTIAPTASVSFQAEIEANVTDAYTTTVEAPAGWNVALDADGLVTATPPAGAAPGEYVILVTAQSTAHPDLVVSARHTVATTAYQGLDVQLAPDPLITTPYGMADPNVLPGDTNSGQVQLPGAAFTATITNTSTTAHTFAIDVAGLPDGWLILSGAEGKTTTSIALPPGGVGRVGLYIKPPTGELPAAGAAYDFTVAVHAADQPSLAQQAQQTFTVPAIAFSQIKAAPRVVYSSPGMTTAFDLVLRNVGTARGAFPISIDLPSASWTAAGKASFELDAGAAVTETVTLTTPDGDLGQVYPVRILSPSGGYTQTTTLLVDMVSPQAITAHRAADVAATMDQAPLAAALHNLGLAIAVLEAEPLSPAARDRVADAATSVVQQLADYPALPASDAIANIATTLRGRTTEAEIVADLAALRSALADLETQLRVIAQYGLVARFTPGAAVTLPGRTATYTLELSNRGSQPAAYVAALTPSLPGVDPSITRTVKPGETVSVAIPITPQAAGMTTLTADVKAVGPQGDIPYVQARATASLRAVDAIATVTAVTASPNFVETGHSAADLSMHVANIANWRMTADATTTVRAPDGAPVFTSATPITIALNDAQNTFRLGRLDTSGFATGVYTVSVELDIREPLALAGLGDITGYTLLSVGQGLRPEIEVAPQTVAPGDAVVTTTISTERTTFSGGATGGGSSAPIMTQTLELRAPEHASSNDPSRGAALHLDAGSYDVAIMDGAIRTSTSGAWYDAVRIRATFASKPARDYYLGYGVDAHTGGSATPYEAIALNRGKTVRIYLPDAADLRFWIDDASPDDASGAMTLQMRKMFAASADLSRQVEGALGWAIPRQQAETLAFDNWPTDNGCVGCHVQTQSLVGLRDAQAKLPASPADPETIAALEAIIRGTTGPDGSIHGSSIETGLGLWSLTHSAGATAAPVRPDLRPAGIQRYEDNHAALRFNGKPFAEAVAWERAPSWVGSAGYVARSRTANDTVALTFNGSWLSLGFHGSLYSGRAAVAVDGVSYGVIDTYRRADQPFSRFIKLQQAGQHTVQLTVLGTRNSFAEDAWVLLDYIDVWDGSAMPDGRFEAHDPRVRSSVNWQAVSLSAASGGQYWERGQSVWFPFTGDSVSYQAIATSAGGKVDVLIDGASQGVFDLYSPTSTPRTFSFGQLGGGPHVLQLKPLRGTATLDAFVTPGAAPFVSPADRAGLVRHEEDHAALQFNGEPYERTAPSWTFFDNPRTSGGVGVASRTAGDTVSLSFSGAWASVGFATDGSSGKAEVLIDGVSQGIVDTYSRHEDVLSTFYRDLPAGSHIMTVKVIGQRNAYAADGWVRLDYIDTWDGTPLPEGQVEERDQRVYASANWQTWTTGDASGGSLLYGGSNIWFPFTGDSVAYQARATDWAGSAEVLIDGQSQGVFDMNAPTSTARSWSFDGLGGGVHMLQVTYYRGRALIDAFVTPGSAPFVQPAPARSGLIRYEEADGALRFNGVPYHVTAQSWTGFENSRLSGGYGVYSRTAGDTLELTFSGTWLNLGFLTNAYAGKAEVRIDGVSRGVIDAYSHDEDVTSVAYAGLSSGAHTVTITVLGQRNANAYDSWVYLDYIDTWDGAALPAGRQAASDQQVYRSSNWRTWATPDAGDGPALYDGSNIWFLFTGASVTYEALAANWAGSVDVLIDGVSRGVFDLSSPTTAARAWSFDGLAPGAHVLQIKPYRGRAIVRAIRTPGSAPFVAAPAQGSGIVRLEEDDATLRYNGAPYRVTAQSWAMFDNPRLSGGYGAYSRTANDTVAVTFSGTWAGLGFLTNAYAGKAEVLIDGVSRGVIDTYSADENVASVYYRDLAPGSHTLTLTVLGQRNANAYDSWVYLDYIDTWDGAALPAGQFEARDARVYLSTTWRASADAAASDGSFVYDGLNAWFPFTGEAVIYQGFASDWAGQVELLIDGEARQTVSLSQPAAGLRRIQIDGLVGGPHMLQLRAAHGRATLDRFEAPPFDQATRRQEPAARNAFDRSGAHPELATAAAPPVQATLSRLDVTLDATHGRAADVSTSDLPTTETAPDATGSVTDTATLARMADFMLMRRQADGAWISDHDGPNGWWANVSGTDRSPALTAYAIVALAKVYELTGDAKYRDGLTLASQTMLTWDYARQHTTALHSLIGLHAALPHVSDSALATQIETRMLDIDRYLRAQQHADGGWDFYPDAEVSDPLPTAGILYALSRLQPAGSDPALRRATEYLLQAQRSDGQWESRDLRSTIMTTTWVDMSLPWIYELLSSYAIQVDHRVPNVGVDVLEQTLAPTPIITPGDAETAYAWQYSQTERERSRTMTYATKLEDMQPGEVRQVTSGTTITYAIESGQNTILLPPQYVQSPHIVRVEPAAQAASPGGQAVYDVALFNPGVQTDTYTLTLQGVPAAWVELPRTVTLPAGATRTVQVTVTPPSDAPTMTYAFGVAVATSRGGHDVAYAELELVDALRLDVTPAVQTADYGQVVTYTLSLENREALTRRYTLDLTGLGSSSTSLPATLEVAAHDTITVPFTVTAQAPRGLYPFTVTASMTRDGRTLSAAADAVLTLRSDLAVTAQLSPGQVRSGPGTPARYRLAVTNTGSAADAYTFHVDLPDGWTSRIEANGAPLQTLSLTPHVLNSAAVWLVATPPASATPGAYSITATVQSTANPAVQARTTASLIVTERGVQVDIQPDHVHVDPVAGATWQVAVTNTGMQADTYHLTASGIVSATAQFAPAEVALAPGETRIVQMSMSGLNFALPVAYPFAVTAVSRSDATIQNTDRADVAFTGYEALRVQFDPASQTLTDRLETSYLLLVTNTGNLETTFTLGGQRAPAGLSLDWEVDQVVVPAHMTAGVLVTVRGASPGTYTITAQAASQSGSVSQTTTALLTIEGSALPTPTATPTSTPTNTATSTPTSTATSTPTSTVTATPPAATELPTSTPTAAPTLTAEPTPSTTPTAGAPATPTPTPDRTATPTADPISCEQYPIALHEINVQGLASGTEIRDILNGSGPGNFGWLSWAGSQDANTLAHSLTPPGDSQTYINPNDAADRQLSIGDWVRGSTGTSNSQSIRHALEQLKGRTIVVPVWNEVTGRGATLRYRLAGFVRVQISDYQLPGQSRISVRYLGAADCAAAGGAAGRHGSAATAMVAALVER